MTTDVGLRRQIRSFAAALVLLTISGRTKCGMCENLEIQRHQSPDGRLDAVLYRRECGATTDFSTQVAVVPRLRAVGWSSTAFVSLADGAEPRAAWGGPPATIEWQGARALVVRYHSKSRVLRSRETVSVSMGWFEKESVTIHYAMSDDIEGGGRTSEGDAQRAAEAEARDLARQLSSSTVIYDHRANIPRLRVVGVGADRLVAIGRIATPSLIEALTNPDRAIAAHLVLCRIWFPGPLFSEEELHSDNVAGLRYRVRELRWTVSDKNGSIRIDQNALKETIRDWCRHVAPAFRAPICQEAG